MSSVTISVSTWEETSKRFKAAVSGKRQGHFISFPTVESLWSTLTPKRWAILRAMSGKGPMSIREVGRLVDRDVKAVHGDVTALIEAGVLDKGESGVCFPFDAVHVDFKLVAA